jgi:hypothetical protein
MMHVPKSFQPGLRRVVVIPKRPQHSQRDGLYRMVRKEAKDSFLIQVLKRTLHGGAASVQKKTKKIKNNAQDASLFAPNRRFLCTAPSKSMRHACCDMG